MGVAAVRGTVRVRRRRCGLVDGDLTATLWLLPDTWSEAHLRRVSLDGGDPDGALSVYVMLLELLAASCRDHRGGVGAARGDQRGSILYVAVAIALWVTMGGTMPVLYRAVLDGPVAEVPALLQGLGWVTVFPLAYLFPDGRFVPRWTRWAAVGWAAYLPALGVAVLLGYESDPDSLIETLPLLVLFGTCVISAVVPLPAGVHPGGAAADKGRGRRARTVVPGRAADDHDTAARPARAGERAGTRGER